MTLNADTPSAATTFSLARLASIFQPAPAAELEITDTAEIASEYRRWQRRVLISSIVGYATFYFVRKNLSIAMPVMVTDRHFEGRALRVCLIYMMMTGFSIFLFWKLPGASEISTAALLGAAGFFIYGPQCRQ